jgi:hypothetical protein
VDLTGAGPEPGLTGGGPALYYAVNYPRYPFGDRVRGRPSGRPQLSMPTANVYIDGFNLSLLPLPEGHALQVVPCPG